MEFFYGRIPKARYIEIEDFAEYLWGEYSTNGRIDPLVILKDQEITHSFSDYGSAFDGLLEFENGEFHVYLNQNRLVDISTPRARFTISHELGHYFIDQHRNGLISGTLAPHGSLSGYQSNEVIEVEADHFASHLLMPGSLFAQKAAKEEPGLKGVLNLSKLFGASRTACGVRYVKQEMLPSALFKWHKEGDGLHWKLLSDSFYRSGFRHSIKMGSSPPSDSGTKQVLGSL